MMLNALLSKGKAKENFRIGIARKLIRTIPIFIGLYYGLISFVWGVTIISFVLTFFNIYYVKKYLGISMLYHIRKVFEGIIPFFALVGVMQVFQLEDPLELILLCLSYLIVYVLYAKGINMDGLELIKSQIRKIVKKSNE